MGKLRQAGQAGEAGQVGRLISLYNKFSNKGDGTESTKSLPESIDRVKISQETKVKLKSFGSGVLTGARFAAAGVTMAIMGPPTLAFAALTVPPLALTGTALALIGTGINKAIRRNEIVDQPVKTGTLMGDVAIAGALGGAAAGAAPLLVSTYVAAVMTGEFNNTPKDVASMINRWLNQ